MRPAYDPLQRVQFNNFPGNRIEVRTRLSEDLARAIERERRTLAGAIGRPPSISLTVEVLLRQHLVMDYTEALTRTTTRSIGGPEALSGRLRGAGR